jgi:hypothetical protein
VNQEICGRVGRIKKKGLSYGIEMGDRWLRCAIRKGTLENVENCQFAFCFFILNLIFFEGIAKRQPLIVS